jgi:hypothetical protein
MRIHMNPNKPSDEDILEEVAYQAALADEEDGASTPQDERWSRSMGQLLDARLAQLRRNLLPKSAPIRKAKPIRQKWLALGRDRLLGAIAELSAAKTVAVQFAYRDLNGLSDDDLRRLLDLLDTSPRD